MIALMMVLMAFASRVEFARTRRNLTFLHLLVEAVHFADDDLVAVRSSVHRFRCFHDGLR